MSAQPSALRLPFPVRFLLCAAAFVGPTGCSQHASPGAQPLAITIGHALPQGTSRVGALSLASQLSEEALYVSKLSGGHRALLAERWQRSSDGLSLTFFLKRGVRFHDGTELTAELARQSLQSSVADRAELFEHPLLSEIAAIVAPERYVLVVQLRRPSLLVFDDLDVRIAKIDSQGKRSGTGPYFLVQQDSGVLRLQAHSSYHGGRPGLDFAELRGYASLRAAWSALMRGEIDALYEVPVEAREFVARETTVRMYPYRSNFAYQLVFNMRRAVWDSKDLRQVLGRVLGRQAIVDGALQGHGVVAFGTDLWDRSLPRQEVEVPVDLPAVRRTLDRVLPKPIHVEAHRPPLRLSFSCLVLVRGIPDERVALFVQKQLYDVGIDMSIHAVSIDEFLPLVNAGGLWEYDAILMALNVGRGLSYQYAFWHSSFRDWPWNFGYDGADEVLDKLRQARTGDEVTAGLRDLGRALREDPPAVFIAWAELGPVVSRRFDVPYESGKDAFLSLWQWRPAAGTPVAQSASNR